MLPIQVWDEVELAKLHTPKLQLASPVNSGTAQAKSVWRSVGGSDMFAV